MIFLTDDFIPETMMPAHKPPHIDAYIANFLPEVQEALQLVRRTIKETLPDAGEAISYAIPAFKLNGNLVHFAGYKNHIGFYPGTKAIAVFKNELTAYVFAKGSIQFPLNKPMPLELIKRIVLYRAEENRAKKKP